LFCLWGFLSGVAFAAKIDVLLVQPPCGKAWFDAGLKDALQAKSYVFDVNSINAGDILEPDAGRLASLGDVPGDSMLMNHWILWFNDYLGRLRVYDSQQLWNRVVVFHSCFEASVIQSDGTGIGNPFSLDRSLRNYEAVFRHLNGPGSTYLYKGYNYLALDDIFAQHPDTLFIVLTSPPLSQSETTSPVSSRVRRFNNWLKGDWLASYRSRNPRINNVAVFDWFDLLANPADDPLRPNVLKEGYIQGSTGASQLNNAAYTVSTQRFASGPGNFFDGAWNAFAKDLLYFAQFGGGAGLTSDLVLTNLSVTTAVSATVDLFGNDGSPLPIAFEGISGGVPVASVEVQMAPSGGVVLRTADQPELALGWAAVTAAGDVSGVVRFGISGAGIAGVGNSTPMSAFVLPVRNEDGVRTGLALVNPGGSTVDLTLTLVGLDGKVRPGGVREINLILPGSHFAQFIDELYPELNLAGFTGNLQVTVEGGKVAATALELGTQPGEFTTLPVAPLVEE